MVCKLGVAFQNDVFVPDMRQDFEKTIDYPV